MEQKAARSNKQVSIESNLKDLVMAMFSNIQNSLDTQQHEQEIRERVHNLSGVRRGIVILQLNVSESINNNRESEEYTSSHQFKVDVTGLQYPALEGG